MPAMAAEKPPLLESATAMIVLRIENRTSCTMQLCRTAFAYGGFVPELPAAEAVGAAEQLSIAPMQALRRTDDGTVEADPLVPVQMQLSIDMDINSLPPGSPERDAFELRCEPRTPWVRHTCALGAHVRMKESLARSRTAMI